MFNHKPKKYLAPSYVPAEWNERNRFEFATFMKTDTGKNLLSVIRENVTLTQISACKVDDKNVIKALGVAQGKEMLFSHLMTLCKEEEQVKEFFMDEYDLKEVLNNRINGNIPQEVEL